MVGASESREPAAGIAEIVDALRADWGIDTVPFGRSGVRFAVVADRGRPPPHEVTLDLLSDEAVAWLVGQVAQTVASRKDALALAAFHLAEALWLVDGEASEVRSLIRLQRAAEGFELVTVER